MRRYVGDRQEQASEASINRELAFLRKAKNYAVQKKLADSNPVGARSDGYKLFKEDNQRVRYVTEDEKSQLHDAMKDEHWPV